MTRPISTSTATLRQEIATRAARLIAEEGMDYASAKRKAARDLLGASRGAAHGAGNWMPDNAEIEEEVRAWQTLFQADSQPARLAALRQAALRLMRMLAEFNPYLTGAALNGTAGEQSDIHLQLFPDSPKDVEIFLLNQGIDYEVHETPRALRAGGRRAGQRSQVETLCFLWQPAPGAAREGVHLALYDPDDLRGALSGEERGERAGPATLERLILEADPAGAASTDTVTNTATT